MSSSSSHPHQADSDQVAVSGRGCVIRQIQGDLFSTTDEALAHCVSENLTMSKGIAVEFKKRYGRVSELAEQKATVGQVAFLDLPAGAKNIVRSPEEEGIEGRRLKAPQSFIFYLITKKLHHQKPTYDSLEASLLDMKRVIIRNNITTLSIPLLGCGLDKLVWKGREPCVLSTIQRVFADLDIRITVYTLPPAPSPA